MCVLHVCVACVCCMCMCYVCVACVCWICVLQVCVACVNCMCVACVYQVCVACVCNHVHGSRVCHTCISQTLVFPSLYPPPPPLALFCVLTHTHTPSSSISGEGCYISIYTYICVYAYSHKYSRVQFGFQVKDSNGGDLKPVNKTFSFISIYNDTNVLILIFFFPVYMKDANDCDLHHIYNLHTYIYV